MFPSGHLKGLRLCPVDIEVELGAVGIERGSHAAKARPGMGRPDQLIGGVLEAGEVIALPVLHHHLKTARLAQPPDGRRDHDEGNRILDGGKVTVEAGDDPVLVERRAAFGPVLVDDEDTDDRGHVCRVQQRITADIDPGLDARGLLQDSLYLVRYPFRPRLG